MRVADGTVEQRVEPVPPAAPGTPAATGRARDHRLTDLLAYGSFLLLAVVVLGQLWLSPNGRVLDSNDDDHGIFMFMIAHGERVIFHGDNPFYTYQLNAPVGVNMMANTSILALSLPLAPVTHFLGPGVTIALLLTLGLAGTAAAWYRVLGRHLVRSRAAAYVGGLWCGFCPSMVSHAGGHVNFTVQFVLPFIVWQVLRLREAGRVRRSGVALGLLIVVQTFINEEALLFVALALAVFVVAYAVMAPRRAWAVAPRMAAGLGVAAGVSGALLAYPLWWQFFGPGNYHGQPFAPDDYVTDLYSLGAFARQSIAGTESTAQRLSVSATEDNTFFGVPVLIMLMVAAVILRRSVAARATAVAGLVLLIAGMGPRLRVDGQDTTIPLPFTLVSHLPVIDLVSVTRFAMVTATVVGVLLALAADRMTGRFSRRARVIFWVALVAALVPVAPKPLPVVTATAAPAFVADGTWRSWVPDGRSVVPVPLPDVTTGREWMRWTTLNLMDFPVPRGYFMGPVDPPGNRTGSWGAPARPTADLLRRAIQTGRAPIVTAADRLAARQDLIFWRAAVVVLGPHELDAVLRSTVTALLGREPQLVGDVWLWDVRDLPVPARG